MDRPVYCVRTHSPSATPPIHTQKLSLGGHHWMPQGCWESGAVPSSSGGYRRPDPQARCGRNTPAPTVSCAWPAAIWSRYQGPK
eukprot:scaffold1033_cov408-Prasinococcus_capsulatus_cf.AAC.30